MPASFERKLIAVVLSHDTVALLNIQSPGRSTLKIMTASTFDDSGGNCPAESVTIQTEGLTELMQLLNKELKVEA